MHSGGTIISPLQVGKKYLVVAYNTTSIPTFNSGGTILKQGNNNYFYYWIIQATSTSLSFSKGQVVYVSPGDKNLNDNMTFTSIVNSGVQTETVTAEVGKLYAIFAYGEWYSTVITASSGFDIIFKDKVYVSTTYGEMALVRATSTTMSITKTGNYKVLVCGKLIV